MVTCCKHTLPNAPPFVGDVLQTHAAERPRGRACPVCSQLNRAVPRRGSGSSVPRPAVCVRASSHTPSNNEKKEVSTTTTQKATRGPWTCGASKKGGSEKTGKGGKNLGPGLTGEGNTPGGKQHPVNPPIVTPKIFWEKADKGDTQLTQASQNYWVLV